jgi:hypothetical protein
LEKLQTMRRRSFFGDLVLGLTGLGLAFAALLAVTPALSSVAPTAGALLTNSLWCAALLATAVSGTLAHRFGLALAPIAFLALWGAGSQIHAGLLAAEAGPKDGLTYVPDVRPVETLIVKAPLGLPVDPDRTGGTPILPSDTCGTWCRDLLLDKGLGAIVLVTPKPGAPKARTRFRRGKGAQCADGTERCIVEEPIDALPDGILVQMGDDESIPSVGELCCATAKVARLRGGEQTVLSTYTQGNRLTVMPVPVIVAVGPTSTLPSVLLRDVPLGPPLRFDTLLEALLDTSIRFR